MATFYNKQNCVDFLRGRGLSISNTKRQLIFSSIKDIVDLGVWNKIHRLYMPIWANAIYNAVCWKSLTSGEFINTVIHGNGYVDGDRIGYFNTKFIPSENGLTSDIYLCALRYTIAGGNQDLIAYRVKDTFNGFENKVPIKFSWFDAAVEGNKPFQIYFTINPSEVTPGTWTDRSVDSVMEYSTDTVWSTDGELLLPFSVAKVGEINQSIKDQNVELLPGDILVIRFVTGATGYDAVTGFKWDELF